MEGRGYNALGVTTLRDSLILKWGSRVKMAVPHKVIAQDCITQAIKKIYQRLPEQEVVTSLTTTDGVAYVAMPYGFNGKFRAPKNGLFIEGQETDRIHYAKPLEWPDLEANYGVDSDNTGTPERWTVRYRDVDGVRTAVLELLPIPDDAYVLRGLRLSVNAPDVEFGTADEEDDYAYLPSQFDDLLQAEATYRFVCLSGILKNDDQDLLVAEMRMVRDEMSRAWADAELLFSQTPIESLENDRVDSTGWLEETGSASHMRDDSESLLIRYAARS